MKLYDLDSGDNFYSEFSVTGFLKLMYVTIMPGFRHSVAALPLPFRRFKIPFCKNYVRKFSSVQPYSKKIRNGNGVRKRQLLTATEERQRNGGNRASLFANWFTTSVSCIGCRR